MAKITISPRVDISGFCFGVGEVIIKKETISDMINKCSILGFFLDYLYNPIMLLSILLFVVFFGIAIFWKKKRKYGVIGAVVTLIIFIMSGLINNYYLSASRCVIIN